MTVTTTNTPTGLHAPGFYSWTAARFEQLYRTGILGEDRVELLLGQIATISPLGDLHNTCMYNLEHYLIPRLLPKYDYWIEKSVNLGEDNLPQPDFCVIKNFKVEGVRPKPTVEEIFVVIEVADSSLEKDQNLKSVVYAQAGIREYWIANLVDRQLEVYTEPTSAGKYRLRRLYEHDAVLSHDLLGTVDLGEVFPF